jgi:hypothetical protein
VLEFFQPNDEQFRSLYVSFIFFLDSLILHSTLGIEDRASSCNIFAMDKTLSSTTLWQNRKCLLLCCLVSMANMQYGFDLAAVGSLQAMPGFLKVFGYPSPDSDTGYAIDVSKILVKSSNLATLRTGLN